MKNLISGKRKSPKQLSPLKGKSSKTFKIRKKFNMMKVFVPPYLRYFQKRTLLRWHLLCSGLSGWYWSSSQNSSTNAWIANFNNGYVNNNNAHNNNYVRLATSFIVFMCVGLVPYFFYTRKDENGNNHV